MMFHFFLPDAPDFLFSSQLPPITDHAIWVTEVGYRAWAVQTYWRLKLSGIPVSCGRVFDPSAVNFIFWNHIERLERLPQVFLVCFRSDRPRYTSAHLHIVQNPTQRGPKRYYVPHWPVPGLIPRDAYRSRVERVGIVGLPQNMAGSKGLWDQEVAKAGLELVYLYDMRRWNDFHDIDVLLAIRSWDANPHNHKPPWKLFTAWRANVPLIAGHDSAYKYHGTPGRDYLVCSTFPEAIDLLCALRDDARFYRELVEAGAAKAKEYSDERLTECWSRLLEEEIWPRFLRWRESGAMQTVDRIVRGTRQRVLIFAKRAKRFMLRKTP